MKESEESFLSISEVSQLLHVPPHVLRFWESKFSNIAPVKRRGGRRFYKQEDVKILQKIRDLLYKDGYTIRGVQGLLAHEHNIIRNTVICSRNDLVNMRHELQDMVEHLRRAVS